MIDVIANLNFNDLKSLDLSYNYFTQFNLFKSIEHFTNLKIFKIGSNEFTEDIDELMKDKKLEYKLQSIEEIDLSLGVFSEKSIKLLSKFKFEKLKILDLNSNNLISLSFIDYFNFSKENDKSDNKDYNIIKEMDENPLKTLILTNAAGAATKDINIGDIILIKDHINFMGDNPLIGKNDDNIGDRFPDMSDCYSKSLRELSK